MAEVWAYVVISQQHVLLIIDARTMLRAYPRGRQISTDTINTVQHNFLTARSMTGLSIKDMSGLSDQHCLDVTHMLVQWHMKLDNEQTHTLT